MKWGVVILLILGVLAAGSAALLMGTWRLGPSASAQPVDIEVGLAKVSLPAGTVITTEDIVMDMVSKDQLPEGSFTSPLQILGNVLAMPVVEGQILTKSCFLKEGIGALLASQIPHGMRGVSVTITSRIMPDSILLYPGCVVDVLVCYQLPNRSDGAEALAQTMLVGIHVLAVSGDSVVSKPAEEGGAKRSSSGRGRLVTLLVNPNQAEALMLAVGSGELSMTLRNPLDKDPVDEEGSLLDRGSLGRKGETIQPTISSNEQVLLEQRSDGDNPLQEGSEDGVPGPIGSVHQPKSTNKSQNSKNSSIDVDVIRGPERKIENFDTPENKTDKTAPEK